MTDTFALALALVMGIGLLFTSVPRERKLP